MKYLTTGFTAFLFFLAAVTSLSAQTKNSIQGDFEALMDLYEVTDGPNWHNNSGWESMTTESMGEAYGVTVYPAGHQYEGRVKRIDLFDNNLVNIEIDGNGNPLTDNTGTSTERYRFIQGRQIPESIGNLRHMLSIQINKNLLSGPIPSSFWTFDRLEVAALGYDDQTNHSNNTENDLVNEDSFYPSKGNYIGNKFTLNNGVGISTEIENMTSLKRLFLERNYFNGTKIPAEITKLQNLEMLMISSNGLVGNFPDGMENLSGSLTHLQAYGGTAVFNRNINPSQIDFDAPHFLSGQLKEGIGYLSNLVELRIDYNNFEGPIPESWSNLESMIHIYFDDMNLGGEFPNQWNNDNMPKLSTFRANRNQFTGSIDPNINWSNIGVLALNQNNLTGELPITIQDHNHQYFPKKIIILMIRYQNIEGQLPEDISSMYRLRSVRLDGNNLTGPLPRIWTKSKGLIHFFLGDNNLSGSFPAGFGEITAKSFKAIYLQNNNITSYETGAISPVVLDSNGEYESGLRRFDAFHISGNSLSQNDLDQIILDLWANVESRLDTEWFNEGTLNIEGQATGEGPSNVPIINEAIENLENSGWSVSFDGDRTPKEQPEIPDTPVLESPVNNASDVSLNPEFSWSEISGTSYTIRVSDQENGNMVLDKTVNENIYTVVDELNYNTTYSWRVRSALDGNPGEWSAPWSFTTEEDPGNGNDNSESGSVVFPEAPILFGPNHQADNISLNPEFTWSDIGADYYILHASRFEPIGMVIDVIVEDTTFTPSEIFGDGSIHDWRVRGVKEGEMGDWSEIRRFTTRQEGLPKMADRVSPGHFAQEINPQTELVWEDVNADSYEIRLINRVNSQIVISDISTSPVYTPNEALQDTTEFIWQVKSIKGGVHGAWGPRWEFSTGTYTYKVETPSLIAPNPGIEYDNLTPVFEWSAVDADHYHISITIEQPSNAKSLSGAQNESLMINDETTETQYMPESALEPETTYYWRVQAVKDENEGEWSEVWEFTTPKEQVSTSPETGEQPLQTTLAQNYPNPFNPSTQIEFTLDEMKRVSLAVYDMAGREVAVLVDGVLNAGKHTNSFSADHLSSGVYFYRLVSGEQAFTKKMTLIK